MGFGIFFTLVFIAVGYCLECPKCHFARNTNECVRHNETCSNFEDECIGKVDEWKISMGCGTAKRCAYEALQANVDCRGTNALGANDKCVVCCTGDTCFQRLDHVQKALDLVPKVLHCPICNDEADPQNCLDNIQPCHASSLTCEVVKQRGRYSSKCAVNSTCMHDHKRHPGTPDCLHDPRLCSVCCNDFSCLEYILGVPPTSPFITPGIVPGGHNSTTPTPAASSNPLTEPPLTTCRDDTLFPCHTAVGAACTDPDISVKFCPRSCGACQTAPTSAVTMPPTATTQALTSEAATKLATATDAATTTSAMTQAATTDATTTPRPPQPLQCPSCDHVGNIHDCLTKTTTCHHSNDICRISVSKWHIKSECKAAFDCSSESIRSSINCTGGVQFGPSDRCTVCCTGDECRTSLMQIQKGFDAIPNVLHCPHCKHESDPQKCIDTFEPCDSHHGTCELSLEHGLFSAKCESNEHCLHDFNRHPGVADCDSNTGKCTTCCHDYACVNRTLSLQTTPLPQTTASGSTAKAPVSSTPAAVATTPTAVTTCKDKDLFPCQVSASATACGDAAFASEFCPLTCGVCKVTDVPTTAAATTRVPKGMCRDSTLYPCLLNIASTCPDADLALLFCPLTCGLCEAGTDMTSPATSPVVTGSPVTGVVPSGQPSLMCPVCNNAGNANECLSQTRACTSHQDVCMVTMKEWRITAGCSQTKYCEFQQTYRSSTNCTGGRAYGPTDKCHVCCTGDQCKQDLNLIEKSLESIPSVLHCPYCRDEADPKLCLDYSEACLPSAINCRISKTNGLYSAECNSDQSLCNAGNPVTDCLDNSTQPCQTCCFTGDCVRQSLSKPTAAPVLTVPADCKDDPTFPCVQSAASVCGDPDFSRQTCPSTCGHCGGSTMAFTTRKTSPELSTNPAVTINVPCIDDPTFPCTTANICDDVDFAHQTCPKTCGHC
ncbi:mucin-5AC-like [Haliotis cracherodii]|uniref:mucin-5AC-like n=1 Tax=Haliotis cracherodii TaxID=6455 RepID=UPI0039E8B2F6